MPWSVSQQYMRTEWSNYVTDTHSEIRTMVHLFSVRTEGDTTHHDSMFTACVYSTWPEHLWDIKQCTAKPCNQHYHCEAYNVPFLVILWLDSVVIIMAADWGGVRALLDCIILRSALEITEHFLAPSLGSLLPSLFFPWPWFLLCLFPFSHPFPSFFCLSLPPLSAAFLYSVGEALAEAAEHKQW